MDREGFIESTINKSMFGLEIGPSYNPSLPRSENWNVETVDHASREELQKKYHLTQDISKIKDMDYVSDARPLHETVPRREEYDFIFASHVVEHLPDLLGFLKSCEILLKPSGLLVLVVPDKRHCFDVLQSITTTGDLLDSHQRNAYRHSAGAVFDFMANTADLGGHAVWEQHWAEVFALRLGFATTLLKAREAFEQAISCADYIDIHAWKFTPSSFRLVIDDLVKTGDLSLREESFFASNRCEFYFSARRGALGCPLDRAQLMKSIAREQISGYMQVLAA